MKLVNDVKFGLRKKRSLVFISLLFVLFLFSDALQAYVPIARQRRTHRRNQASFSKWISNTPINFSTIESKFFDKSDFEEGDDMCVWERQETNPFTELILSWNALRPSPGSLTFWVNVKYGNNTWSGWQRMAEWGERIQRSFINKTNPYVHTKHVRVEMQHGIVGNGFKVKVTFNNGADPKELRALFVCLCDLKKFKLVRPNIVLPTTFIRGVPKQSQMVLDHPRFRDLCSATSTSIIVNYFTAKLNRQPICKGLDDYVGNFADKVYDPKLNIYGNWQLNVAQAFDAANGDVFFRVERLNGFRDLHAYLMKKIPVVVSVHRLTGGALPYKSGHFMVVVGWNQAKQQVLCIDPAFKGSSKTLRSYKFWDFLQAWGRSVNLSYIPMPKDLFYS